MVTARREEALKKVSKMGASVMVTPRRKEALKKVSKIALV